MIAAGKTLLLLIPAYNEEARIETTLRAYAAEFDRSLPGQYTILVLLNGCRDRTIEVVERVRRDCRGVCVLDFPGRIGKGGALIEGLKASPQADWIAYVDADGATPPRELLRLASLCQNRDCVIGSRWLPGSILHRPQTRARQLASRIFHCIVQALFRLNVQDTQCPAKVFSKKAAEAVRPNLRIADLAFDVNLLYAMKRAGCKIHEEPTEWTDQLGSKVTQTLFRSSLVMLLSVLRLRLYYSPVYRFLQPFRGVEKWIYLKLRAPFIPWGENGDKE